MFGAGLTDWIVTGGLFVIAATIFVECGFFGGFFLPGDSLLFLAGFLAGQGTHNIVFTIIVILLAAVLGNCVGYLVGNKLGPRLFSKEDGIFFQKRNILRAQQFYEKHGGKTLILARFVPVLRTFAPLVAGIGTMTFRKFFVYSTAGAAMWAILVPSTGFWAYRVLGHKIDIAHYMEPVFVGIIVFSIGISVFHGVREKRLNHRIVSARELEAEQAKVKKQID